MKYIIDIDGTICNTVDGDYYHSTPMPDRIRKVNDLYDAGHTITYWTARGGNSGIDWSEYTRKQLESWGCKYHQLKMGKPVYDLWVDDKAVWSEEWFK